MGAFNVDRAERQFCATVGFCINTTPSWELAREDQLASLPLGDDQCNLQPDDEELDSRARKTSIHLACLCIVSRSPDRGDDVVTRSTPAPFCALKHVPCTVNGASPHSRRITSGSIGATMTASVVTRSYDFYRIGANDGEVTLSASAVRSRGIAKLFSMAIPDDPRLEAQPLAVGNVRLSNGQMHDVVFQASMGNTVYAFDAATGGELWKTNLGRPIVGTRQIDAWLVNVSWGILSTPVIDEAA